MFLSGIISGIPDFNTKKFFGERSKMASLYVFLHAKCRISCFNERERAFNERDRAFNLQDNNSRHIHVRVEYTKRSIVKEDIYEKVPTRRTKLHSKHKKI